MYRMPFGAKSTVFFFSFSLLLLAALRVTFAMRITQSLGSRAGKQGHLFHSMFYALARIPSPY